MSGQTGQYRQPSVSDADRFEACAHRVRRHQPLHAHFDGIGHCRIGRHQPAGPLRDPECAQEFCLSHGAVHIEILLGAEVPRHAFKIDVHGQISLAGRRQRMLGPMLI